LIQTRLNKRHFFEIHKRDKKFRFKKDTLYFFFPFFAQIGFKSGNLKLHYLIRDYLGKIEETKNPPKFIRKKSSNF